MLKNLTFIALALCAAAALAATDAPTPTYCENVAAILNQNCVTCHRPGQAAPMSLMSYQEVRPWVKSIAKNVEAREMPPWHADPAYGHFRNDRSLDQTEIDTIVSWVRAGAPEGDPAKLPPAPQFPASEWVLGEPDLIVEFPQVEVPGGGPDQFHQLVGKVMLKEDKWIKAVEVMPGNRQVVHHVIAIGVKGFDIDPSQGWLGAWAAGTEPMVFPEGTGRFFPKGSNIIGDMHYHPTETPQTDVTRLGLHFAEPEDLQELANIWVQNDSFTIPAGDPDHEVRARYTFWQDGKIMGFIPHMHYRGKDFTYTAKYPDGTSEILLRVPRYDFGWQTNYMVAEPISIPAGTVIETVAHYDNSTNNPDNPDPNKTVTFGNESYDEMHIGFIDFVADEGVRMRPMTEIRREQLPIVAAKHPGETYAVTAGDPENVAPLVLPREGEGVFYVIFDGQLVPAKVWDIEWQGTSFTASVASRDGEPIPFNGTVSADGSIETHLGKTTFSGRLYDGRAGSATGGR